MTRTAEDWRAWGSAFRGTLQLPALPVPFRGPDSGLPVTVGKPKRLSAGPANDGNRNWSAPGLRIPSHRPGSLAAGAQPRRRTWGTRSTADWGRRRHRVPVQVLFWISSSGPGRHLRARVSLGSIPPAMGSAGDQRAGLNSPAPAHAFQGGGKVGALCVCALARVLVRACVRAYMIYYAMIS